MTFTEDLWAATADLQDAILAMPFNRDMADGTLPLDTFRAYIVQDAHYLEGFSRALSLAAARAPDAAALTLLSGSAHGTMVAERQLHEDYMARYGIAPDTFAATPPSRACDHYCNFLIRSAATDPFPVAVAAILPCFWIYRVVGEHIHATAAPDHPYRAWIETYAGESFAQVVQDMLDLTDRVAETADPATRAAMHRAFSRGSWHEWMFWQSAYDREVWPAP